MDNITSVADFLSENAIQYKTCNHDEPFVFISYSHAFHDATIVQNVFQMLYIKGFNQWIDVANIPFDHNSWKNAALKALHSENCKVALFFRSENSLTKEAVADEIEILTASENTRVVTVDIWTNPKSTAQSVYNNLQRDMAVNPDDEEIRSAHESCRRICERIDPNNSAIRLGHECHNDAELLVEKIVEVIKSLGMKSSEIDEDDDFDFGYDFSDDGECIKLDNKDNSSKDKIKVYAQIANEEIIRNVKEFEDNDFGVLTERLKGIQGPLEQIEDVYKKLATVKDKNTGIKRSILFRRDIIGRIFWITLVVFVVGLVFISTLEDTDIYYLLDDHIMSWSIVTDIFTIDFDESVQLFVNTILVALFDSIIVTFVIVFIPALVKLIIMLINSIRIRSIRRKGEKLIMKLPVIPNFSLNYMCTFAVSFFIRCYRTRQETEINGAIAAFNEYKKSPDGLREIALIAPWLHDMREGFRKTEYKL